MQVDNKVILAEAIITYHVLVKQIAMLDNFAKGLDTLGVLNAICMKPYQFEHQFVYYNKVQASTVLKRLKFITEDESIKRIVRGFMNSALLEVLHLLLT